MGTAPWSPDTRAVFDAPKPPSQRVSLSPARPSRARQVMFLVSGEAKHRAIFDWRAGKNIPARAITPVAGVDVLVEFAPLLPLKGLTAHWWRNETRLTTLDGRSLKLRN